MNYHNIVHDDMNNGDGLRVTIFLSGCSHHCKGCQNPQTWDENGGIKFDEDAKNELFEELSKNYINGITFSGGDPLHYNNYSEVLSLCKEIKNKFYNKNIWLYTGYTLAEILSNNYISEILNYIDILIDGKYIEEHNDNNLHWRGSSNQKIINISNINKG